MSLVLLTVFCSCGYVLAQSQQQAIPSTFFGIHVNNPTITQNETSYPVQVGYGEFRNWDVYHVSWPDVETCEAATDLPSDTCFGSSANFQPLQTELLDLNSAGVSNVTITLSRTPKWADQNTNQQTDPNCNYFDPNDQTNKYGGACYAPTGFGSECQNGTCHLNPDGTGDDLIWRNWVTAIATYVNNYHQTWCGTNCAHVKYWEIWNEFDRNNTNYSLLDPNSPNTKVSWYASTDPTYGCQVLGFAPCPTPDQLVRMTEDARCIINGTGYVDNYPTNGAHTPCNQLGSGWIVGIDNTAEIVQPSVTSPKATNALQCYLYCNQAACGAWYKVSASTQMAGPTPRNPWTSLTSTTTSCRATQRTTRLRACAASCKAMSRASPCGSERGVGATFTKGVSCGRTPT